MGRGNVQRGREGYLEMRGGVEMGAYVIFLNFLDPTGSLAFTL